jgi:threonine dehydratase
MAVAALTEPTLADVLDARRVIGPHLPRTALHRYPLIDELVGTAVYVKHENHQPIGAFKVRGGVNLVARLDEKTRASGVWTASTGNHGQSIAFAARIFGVPATIVVPEGANPVKVASMRSLGAEVVFHGPDYDAARFHAEELANQRGGRFVHSGDEPHLIAGVGTEALELLEQEPGVDVIIVPVGGGSGAAGCCVVAKAINPAIQVIAVQSEAAQAAYLAWRDGRPVESPNRTFAEGLMTGASFDLPQRILRDKLDDFVLLEEDEIRRATRHMIERTKNLVEPAGASSLAGAIKLRDRLAGRRVAIICSGGNLSPAQAVEILSEP